MKFIDISRLEDLNEGATFKPVFACLILIIMPFVWSVLGFLTSLFTPVGGILDGISKLLNVWLEGKELLSRFQTGTFLTELKSFYLLALYGGIVILSLLALVAGFSFLSNLVKGKYAFVLELIALIIWAVPYWAYRILCTLNIVIIIAGLVYAYFWAFALMIKTYGLIAAIIGGIFVLGILAAGLPVAYVGFMVAFSPLYFSLRYVVSLGLILARPNGTCDRWLKKAFAEGNNIPFWEPFD